MRISTRCCCPTVMSADQRVRVDDEAELLATARAPASPRARSSSSSRARVGSIAEHDVLGDRHHRDEHEVLVHHPDSGARSRPSAELKVTGSPCSRISPASGLVEAVEDVHQRRLAGAVLAEQGVHLAAAGGRGRLSSLATTPGNAFVIPRSSRTGRPASCAGHSCAILTTGSERGRARRPALADRISSSELLQRCRDLERPRDDLLLVASSSA